MRNALFAFAALTLVATSAEAGTQVVLDTTHGQIVLELDEQKAPITSKNFLSYVDAGFYNGVIFHRVIKSFMLQGGGFTQDLKRKTPQAPIKNESNNGLKNERGTLSMARTSNPNSATSQFFVNLVNNAFLDARGATPGYAVFAKVVAGMDVVDKIGSVKTHCPSKPRGMPCNVPLPPGMRDVPAEPVMIKKAYRK